MARVARKGGLPVLRFCFFVFRHQTGHQTMWRAHSVLTGQTAEGPDPDAAIRNLTRAIDAEFHLATTRFRMTTQEWYASQEPDDAKYVLRFLEAAADMDPEQRTSRAPSGRFVLQASVVRAA